MKTFWKVLGATAAVAALTPYRVEKDEENGGKKIQALLWSADIYPREGENKMAVDVSFGFNIGFNSPLADKKEDDEPLFDEEPVAEFTVEPIAADEAVEAADEAAAAADEAAEAADEAAAEAEIEAIENGAEAAPEDSGEPEASFQE